MPSREFEAALQRINATITEVGTTLWLLNAKAGVLLAQRKFLEAYDVYCSMLASSGLRSEARTVLSAVALKALAQAGQMERFRSELDSTLKTKNTVLEKLYVLDCLASFPIYDRTPGFLSEALRCCDQALSLQPGNLTVQATQGCLFFEAGKLDESEVQLKKVYSLSESPTDKGLTSLYLALICKKRGQSEKALRIAKRAARLAPIPTILVRLEEEFPQLQTKPGREVHSQTKTG